jgi:glycosyltransferase involved in cell wall biosynthesis
MRVAVLIDTWFPFVGGGQINAWEVSKRLALKGTEVEIITRNSGKDNHKNLNKLKIIKLGKFSKTGDNLARLEYLWHAFFYINQSNFDLTIAHAFLPGLVAKMFMLFKKKPALFVVHGTSIGTNLNYGVKSLIEKFILTRIKYSAQITVSRDFLKIKNINKNVVYIPNGVDPIFFKPQINAKRLKNTLLFVGRLHPQKNLINLIKAITIVKNNKHNIKLTIAGEGSQKKELQKLIKKEKLERNAVFAGIVKGKDLVNLYYKSELFVLPSIYEGQPLSILEALATKTPVVASKTGDIPFMVQDGVNGYLIADPQNPQNIANKIERALNNRKLNKMGELGYQLTKENLSWELTAKETLNVYENIVNK